jgi:hypothetical protein
MKNYVVCFERLVAERATIITAADSKNQAIENAREFLTESDYEREEVEPFDVSARLMREAAKP